MDRLPDTPAPAAAPAAQPSWYKDAVIYELHIKAFCDGNGDGIGDFAGLISRLDHVRDLGVNTLWLLPFYPSPLRDDGYDVADFLGVHAAYGCVADVAQLVQQAHARGLRVITELVVNHTSDQHPWFQAARHAPRGSVERDFYVWSDDPTRYAGTRIIFTDSEVSNWTWDEVAGQYFWHRFFHHQPDLNFDNPAVREAVFGVMEFWLDKGVDGFRLDAIPYLIEREGSSNENLRETHAVIKELRQRLDAKYSGKLLLAEANMWPEDVREYFGDADECHMAYHFPLMPRMYMAMAQEDRHPVVEILQQTPEIPSSCQWAIFLRNHDELTLEMVTSKERDYMYSMYAAEPRARINLGIRRRLAPLLDNDRERIKLMNSLLLSMPGSPVLYYGDEIGMGDNIFLGDRDGVRTPMQWSGERNGGFSRADPQRLVLPPIQDPVYGYEAVNVEAQSRDTSSLLNWTRRLLAVRRSTPVFGRGRITLLHPGNRKILAYLRELDGEGGEAVLCVANLGRSAQPVELDLARFKGRVPVEMAGHTAFAPVTEQPYALTLPAHGFFWFRLSTDTQPPDWHAQRQAVQDLAVLVLFDGWDSLFRERVLPWRIAMATRNLAQFEAELLPRFLARQRWFRAAVPGPQWARVADHAVLAAGDHEWLLAFVDTASTPPEPSAHWWVPLSLAWEDGDEQRHRQLAPAALAKVRLQARVGVMADALADAAFGHALVQAVAAGSVLPLRGAGAAGLGRKIGKSTRPAKSTIGGHGALHGVPSARFAAIAGPATARPVAAAQIAGTQDTTPPRALATRHSTVARVGERLFLKLLRQVQPGPSAEVEMGQFLQDVAYEYCAALAGSVELVAADGSRSTLALLHAWVPNQGNVWTLAVQHLARELERAGTEATAAGRTQQGSARAAIAEGLLASVRLLGRRSADLHAALASRPGDPIFAPEPLRAADLQQWAAQARSALAATTTLLLPPHAATAPQAARLAVAGATLEHLAQCLSTVPVAGQRIRIHGAYCLQEVLLVNDDFVIVDFKGGAQRPASERRSKQSPLRDVATLLHSIDLARLAALQASPHSGAEQSRREARARDWADAMRGAFVDSYASCALAAGLWPDTATLTAQLPLCDLFETELAVAELGEALRQPGTDPATAWAALDALLARHGAA